MVNKEIKEGKIGFRVDSDLKSKWQLEAKKKNMSLTSYIIHKMENNVVLDNPFVTAELRELFIEGLVGDFNASPPNSIFWYVKLGAESQENADKIKLGVGGFRKLDEFLSAYMSLVLRQSKLG